MPLEYRIDQPEYLITVTAAGETSEKKWMDLFLNIKGDPDRLEGMDFLFDLRESRSTVSDEYLWSVSRRLIPMLTTKKTVKWAFVTLREVSREKVEKFSRQLAESRNIEIRVFSDPDGGLGWIGEDKELRHRDEPV
jgi:hypothetical protein